ncbi:MAG: prenyltransferase/squalene oxidase repeat-containing protein [Thermodesulfobacteriota bacterium]
MRETRFWAVAVCVAITLSGICAWAIEEERALVKAAQYLSQSQTSAGGWPLVAGEGDAEAETTAWAVRALIIANGDPQSIENGVSFLLKSQNGAGSVNDNIAHTAFFVIALDAAGKGTDERTKAIDWLIKSQDEDGGWGRHPTSPSLSIYTAVALKALAQAGKKSEDPVVRKALEYLEAIQNPDGGWPMPKGGNSLALGTAWVLNALADFNVTRGTPLVDKGLDFLMQCRKVRNGGFSIVPPAAEDPEITAYAMLAMAAQKVQRDALKDAAYYLAAVQLPDGAFVSDTPMEFQKQRKKNVQTTCFVVWALKSAGF